MREDGALGATTLEVGVVLVEAASLPLVVVLLDVESLLTSLAGALGDGLLVEGELVEPGVAGFVSAGPLLVL